VLNRMEHNNVSSAMRPALEELGDPVMTQIHEAVDEQRASRQSYDTQADRCQ